MANLGEFLWRKAPRKISLRYRLTLMSFRQLVDLFDRYNHVSPRSNYGRLRAR
jgi:hypothetical protein